MPIVLTIAGNTLYTNALAVAAPAPAPAPPAFTDVPGPTGATNLVLAWDLPNYNADGTSLSPSLSYQRVLYDTVSRAPLGGYAYAKYINSGTATGTTISSLAVGTYYCVLQTYNGTEWSESSSEFAKAST
jgi:hypothetical protein